MDVQIAKGAAGVGVRVGGFVVLTLLVSVGLLAVQANWAIDPAALALVQFAPAIAAMCVFGMMWWSGGFAESLPQSIPARRMVLDLAMMVAASAAVGVLVMVAMSWHGAGLVGPSAVGNVPFSVFLGLQLLGAYGEEIGWRGFMQPVLESRIGRFAAILLTGIAWALWHVQAYTHGPVVGLSFFVSAVAFAVLLGYLANGDVWQRITTAAVGHWLINIGLYVAVGDDTLGRPQVIYTAVGAVLAATAVVGVRAIR